MLGDDGDSELIGVGVSLRSSPADPPCCADTNINPSNPLPPGTVDQRENVMKCFFLHSSLGK